MAAVRQLVVVGRDTAAYAGALALARSLAPIGVTVRVVELPSALPPDAVHAALPALGGLHAMLGLRDEAVFAHCAAAPSMGSQYLGWSETPFVLGQDVSRPGINDVDFVQFWSLARRNGMRVPFEDFSLASAAARQGRVSDGKPGAAGDTPRPGWHIDARSYAALLRQGCVAAKIEMLPGEGLAIERDGERVRALTLADGRRIEADLYLDASGTERLLGAGAFESGSAHFPATRLVTGSLPPLDPMPAHSRIARAGTGWIGLYPLQGRTAVMGHIGEGDPAALFAGAGVPLPANLNLVPFAPGKLAHAWHGNIVAIGDAAIAAERLDNVELHLLQIALTLLIAHWPVDAAAMPEARDYNAAMDSHFANIRDYQLAHYATAPTASLAARTALFAARGIVPFHDDETFEPQSWAALLIGQGIVPAESDPAVARTPEDEQIGKMQQLLHLIAAEVRTLPTVADYIAARRGNR